MFIIDIMMAISNWLWGWPLLILTSAVAVYLSVRFKFFQFTRFGHAMKNTFGKIFDKGDGEGDISPFQACCTALASTLGVGNIAGVSVAIATGGFAGSTVMLAIRWGLARGVYSNEAGTGMAPLAHSSSSANHPVKQGLWGISEVFVDTIIVCTMTALVVLCTGVWTEGGTGAALTATAFGAGFGNAIAGTVFVVAIITFFAFTTALVNVYYGEICMTVLGGKKFILPYRLLGCAFAIIGSVGALSVLWNLFDFFFGVCAVCNLVVCFLMRKQIGALINDYLTRLKSGKWEPTSEAAANAIPELWVNDKAAK